MFRTRIKFPIIGALVISGIFIIFLNRAAQSSGHYQLTPEPLPTTFAGQPIVFQQLTMLNEQDGWAVATLTDDNFYEYILQTEDGGNSWQDVTPYREAIKPHSFFMDQDHAWVLTSEVWQTEDGGASWTNHSLPGFTTDSAILSFPDAIHGWILVLDCCAAGNEFGWLYQTVDGGDSWVLIADSDSAGYQFGTLTNRYHTGMVFANAQEGWMTTASISGTGEILHTIDGGKSWEVISTISQCAMIDPTLFSPQSLAVVADCYIYDDQLRRMVDIYKTTDAGQHWTIQNINASFIDKKRDEIGATYFSLPFSMISPDVSWILVSPPELSDQPPNILHQTRDGGRTWIQLSEVPIELTEYSTLMFIDDDTGWAFDQTGTFLRTDDAGQTWIALAPRLR